MAAAVATGFFNITSISPALATTASDSVVTLRGVGLDQLVQIRYRSNIRLEARAFDTQSYSEATAVLPCPRLGLGVFTLAVTILGEGNQEFNAHGEQSGGNTDPLDAHFLCVASPRHDGMRPFVGPSWPGTTVRLTTTLHNADRCAGYTPAQKYLCNPPPFNILEQSNLFAATQLEWWPSTIDIARCRWVCLSGLGCDDGFVDVIGRVTAAGISTIDCEVPAALSGRTGKVEIQISLDGTNFARPGRLATNTQRPKYQYYFYYSRIFERAPAGGPLRGGTSVTFIGEGLDGYGAALDAILDNMEAENIFASNSWYVNSGGLPASRQHDSRGAVLISLRNFLKCRVSGLGEVAATNVQYQYNCNPATTLWPNCFENVSFSCFVPPSASAQTLQLHISSNDAGDAQTPKQWVPVTGGGDTPVGGDYTYYVQPTVSLLLPPGGPTRGATTVTLRGAGFDGLGGDVGGFGCSFGVAGGE